MAITIERYITLKKLTRVGAIFFIRLKLTLKYLFRNLYKTKR